LFLPHDSITVWVQQQHHDYYEMAKIAFVFVGNNRKDWQKESSNIFDKTYNSPEFLLNLKHTPPKNITWNLTMNSSQVFIFQTSIFLGFQPLNFQLGGYLVVATFGAEKIKR